MSRRSWLASVGKMHNTSRVFGVSQANASLISKYRGLYCLQTFPLKMLIYWRLEFFTISKRLIETPVNIYFSVWQKLASVASQASGCPVLMCTRCVKVAIVVPMKPNLHKTHALFLVKRHYSFHSAFLNE